MFGISEMAERKLNQLASGGRALSFASGYRWRMASDGSWNRRSLMETGKKELKGKEREQIRLIGFALESDYTFRFPTTSSPSLHVSSWLTVIHLTGAFLLAAFTAWLENPSEPSSTNTLPCMAIYLCCKLNFLVLPPAGWWPGVVRLMEGRAAYVCLHVIYWMCVCVCEPI